LTTSILGVIIYSTTKIVGTIKSKVNYEFGLYRVVDINVFNIICGYLLYVVLHSGQNVSFAKTV